MKSFYGFIFVLLLISFDLHSQVKPTVITNKADRIDLKLEFHREAFNLVKEKSKDKAEYSNYINEGLPGSPVLPSKTIFIAIPPHSKVNPILTVKRKNTIANVDLKLNPGIKQKDDKLVYSDAIPDQEYFTNDSYPVKDVEVTGYTWIRDYYCAVIKINTHHYNWKKKEVTEFFEADLKINFSGVQPFNGNRGLKGKFDEALNKIILNYEFADQYRAIQSYSSLSDTTGEWIEYGIDYVKLAISSDDIFKITYNDLVAFGVNPSTVDPTTFRIFFEGEELPVFIYGENDLAFDQSDYIEFYAEKNYGSPDYKEIVSAGENYLNYYDRYNDTNFVWLTWRGANGLRTDSINTFNSSVTDSVKDHLVKLHLEHDVRLWYYDAVSPRVQFPYWQENKVWTWQILGNGGIINLNFDTPDFIPNTSVKTTTRLISNAADITSDAHSSGVSLNSSVPVDTIFYDFKETVNLSSQFASNVLNQTGTGNTFSVYGLQTQAGFHQSLIDWLDVDFIRANIAVDDSIMISIPDSVIASERIIVVSNISGVNDLYLYKIKPQLKRITAYNFSSGILTFTDNVSGGDKYLIIKDAHKKTPRFVVNKQFVNLRDPSRIADYIIITNKELEASVNQYKTFIETDYQVNVQTIFINDIYDEFSFGMDNVEAVKDFLYTANLSWQSPKPSFLNLIGDANYDYKKVIVPADGKERRNLTTSYGNPVSDVWFVTWDSLNINIPQMFVGRIPAANNDDVFYYLQKHQQYLNRQFDEWNKNYLFFSGGDINNANQLAQIKEANDNLLNQIVKPKPVGGSGKHFYKTINPPTNYGTFTLSEVRNAIDEGGLFISYIGHSGTQTWDNGITSTDDLKNIFADRNPLITDFGCSTGKFAEPDIDAFGELFLLVNPGGQSINYLGNTSWGYLSTSLAFPDLFYSRLLIDTISTVGEAHLLAKVQQFNNSGFTEVNRVFNYCNLLFGDPVISFKTPPKPNYVVRENSFSLVGNNPDDMTDSVTIKVEIQNAGRVPEDSLQISVSSFWASQVIFQDDFKIASPLFKDTLSFTFPVEGRVGQHTVQIELDNQDIIDELYENDNSASYTYTVFSTSVRPIETEKYYNTSRDSVRVLNPALILNNVSRLKLSVADNSGFQNATEISKVMDSLYTVVNFNSLPGKRYWWKVKLDDESENWSDVYSFKNINPGLEWFVSEDFIQNDLEYFNTSFDSASKSWKLTNNENLLEISSAGANAGAFASFLYNGQEYLTNTYYWGIGTAEIDTITLEPKNFRFFLFGDPNVADSMIAYLDSFPDGTVIAMAVCDDGAQSVLGFSGGTPVRRAIENYGSLYVDSVRYIESWCIIGKKGAPQGSVPESYKKDGLGPAEVSSSNVVNNDNGFVVFPVAEKSSEWINIEKNDSLPSGSSVQYLPLGIKANGDVDTLNELTFSNNISSLNNIDASIYPSLKILAKLNANEVFVSPSIISLGMNFNLPPELAINYQVVKVEPDTLFIGEDVKLNFAVYNVSVTASDSFKILVEVVNSDNLKEIISDIPVNGLASLSKKFFEIELNTLNYPGNNNFTITIDHQNKITEIFEDNNFYQIPFYIKPDTSTPTMNITFDGVDILDGEYISPNPEIKIELYDQSRVPINDPSAVSIFLNDEEISPDTSVVTYEYSSSNPKVIVTYKPNLRTGNYSLKVFGKNTTGSVVDSSGIEKHFIVNEETELLNVFNYPNPSSGETYFTFKLTQIPDELRIRIFTVAGRLIKEIKLPASQLDYDFNTIFWDGKDDAHDKVANGIYFYKVIITRNGESKNVTQKLAIVR